MIALLISLAGWAAAYLAHLSLQPSYRRYAPYRFPFTAQKQRLLRLTCPISACVCSAVSGGITGVFVWGFSASLIGIVIALLCASRT